MAEYVPQTHELTIAQTGVTLDAVLQRIAKNGAVVAVRRPGYVDVFQRSTHQHMARYLIAQRVLWHRPRQDRPQDIPRDWLAEYTGPWPPDCPICGKGPMIPKFRGPDRIPFWSCRNWSGGHGCHGSTEFFPHPQDYRDAGGDLVKAMGDSLTRLSAERRQAALAEIERK